MTFRKLALVAVLCALPTTAFAAGLAKPGKWQVTMQSEIPNLPMKMPPFTFTHCLTKEQAENPESSIPAEKKDSDCKRTDLKVDGNTVTWKVTCEKSKMTGEGKVTYTDDAYTGAMNMTMPQQGEMTVKYTGKYLGACDK